jgi:hypothetical protein
VIDYLMLISVSAGPAFFVTHSITMGHLHTECDKVSKTW